MDGRGVIMGRSGGGEGQKGLRNKDPCPNTITHPHPNQNHCPRGDTVSTRTISVRMRANGPGQADVREPLQNTLLFSFIWLISASSTQKNKHFSHDSSKRREESGGRPICKRLASPRLLD